MAQYPQIQVHLQERISSVIAKAVTDNAADVGILNDGLYGEGLSLLPYQEDELVVIAPKGHALARRKSVRLAQVLDHEFVGAHPGSAMNNLLTKAAADLGRPLRLRIHVRSFDAMCQMVAAGLGIAVLPVAAAQPLGQALGLRLIELSDTWVERELLLGARDLNALARPVRTLLDHLVACRG